PAFASRRPEVHAVRIKKGQLLADGRRGLPRSGAAQLVKNPSIGKREMVAFGSERVEHRPCDMRCDRLVGQKGVAQESARLHSEEEALDFVVDLEDAIGLGEGRVRRREGDGKGDGGGQAEAESYRDSMS